MKHPVALGFAVALALALAAAAALRLAIPPGPAQAGVEAFDPGALWAATLPDLAGRIQPLSQWRGKVLVLNFWAPWCPPCRKEIPGFIRLHRQYAGRGLQFVGIAMDSPDKVAAYADATGIPYPLLLGADEAGNLALAAGNRSGGLPYTVVLDRQGNAIASQVGAVDDARLEGLIKPLL